MKLFRYTPKGQEQTVRCALELPDGRQADITSLVCDLDASFWRSQREKALQNYLQAGCPNFTTVPSEIEFLPPVPMPSKIVCAGLNYKAHKAEFQAESVPEPALFLKAPSAFCAPFSPTLLPPNAECLDYEVELALVIKTPLKNATLEEARKAIAGYTLLCDYSERHFQLECSGQWTKGKSYDSFAPLGPYLVSPDEFEAQTAPSLWLKVEGEERQNAPLSSMICSPVELLVYASRFMTLLSGDILSTGSPGGVAMGRPDKPYLKAGQVVTLGGTGLGEQRHLILEDV